jgi:outer membrane protein TolC
MRSINPIILILLVTALKSPAQTITLRESIDAALNNKAGILSAKTDALVSGLQAKAEYARYLPQISVSYDYRYYATRPSQIIPVGLFSEAPTDEKRAIQFGTPWQQNAGITLYQPLIDLSITRESLKADK